eukprot:jgi/Picsp_1/5309/NSC_02670-R1_vacuolar protein sorting-associated protein
MRAASIQHIILLYTHLVLICISYSVLAFENVETSGPSCSVQQAPPTVPIDGIECSAANESASIDQAKDRAWKFAPIIKFHPDERYYPQSMPVWYNASRLVLPDGSDPRVQKEYRTLIGSTGVSDEERDSIIAGASFSEDGGSSADIYYTVENYDGRFWLYNYDIFYSWNGCSNQELSLGDEVLKYLMCPAGEHEGDLERLSVLVCKSDFSIKRIGYNQHAWSEVRDCDAGDCPIDAGGHPIVYSSLESHALYPEDNGFHVYYNLGPLFVGDRTGDDPERMFVPNFKNVVYVPPLLEIQDEALDWARFSGNWGSLLPATSTALFCFPENQGLLFENACPASPATQLVTSVSSGVDLAKPASEQFMNGPLFRPSNYQIKGTNVSPILESEVSFLTCADDASGQGRSSPVAELLASPILTEPPPMGDPTVAEGSSVESTNGATVLAPPVMQPMASDPPSVTQPIVSNMPASDAICRYGGLSILSVMCLMFVCNTMYGG